MNHNTKAFRLALLACLLTACWFALSGTLKTWLAHSSGKTIEMVVCSGSGIKKIYLSVSSSQDASGEVSVKHCSNAPLALATEAFNPLQHLAYATPKTPATWHWNSSQRIERDWLSNGRPPPGRAPPALHIA